MKLEIKNTISSLKKGKKILYPTDTVWGLGCDVFDENAIKQIYQIKNREDSKSLILLVSDLEMLQKYVEVSSEVIQMISEERPTTIVYQKVKKLPNYLLASDGSVAIRVVKDEFCQKLIKEFGKPIVSTSANVSGEPTAQIFSEISDTILREVDYVVNWRQDDQSRSQPSRILMVEKDGNYKTIRE